MNPLDALSPSTRRAIVSAALLAHEDRPAEAEAARWAGNYHNLPARTDADCPKTLDVG
jgi:hypothetical protein